MDAVLGGKRGKTLWRRRQHSGPGATEPRVRHRVEVAVMLVHNRKRDVQALGDQAQTKIVPADVLGNLDRGVDDAVCKPAPLRHGHLPPPS